MIIFFPISETEEKEGVDYIIKDGVRFNRESKGSLLGIIGGFIIIFIIMIVFFWILVNIITPIFNFILGY